MNKDFHYYATYTAARLAGYDFESSQTIAHAAQYVDDSDMSMLKRDTNNYYITDFEPIPTVQSNMEILKSDTNWCEKNLNVTTRTWPAFHFLPGNYEENAKLYSGPQNDKGYTDYWQFDMEAEEQFKLLCLPNSRLVKDMINDIIINHSGKAHELHMIGLRMHVLADTWAHMYYAGIPAWFINTVEKPVYNVTHPKRELIKWNQAWPLTTRYNLNMATPNMPSYNSYVYLGHARMGHVPDYPWIKYQYIPQWSSQAIIKDNTQDFMSAFTQMVEAMYCIKNRLPFDVNLYSRNISTNNIEIITQILSTEELDQCQTWKNKISNIIINNMPLRVPEDYNFNQWINAMKTAEDIRETDYYHFNISAFYHLNFVKTRLENNYIFLDKIPKENTVTVSLKSASSLYIGAFENFAEYYPKMRNDYIKLKIVKPNAAVLKNNDIIKLKTTEEAAGEYNYLGAWKTTALYYYTKDYSTSKQRWQIEKVCGSPGEEIQSGDTIKIKNIYFTEKPYISTYDWFGFGKYLTTTNNSEEASTNWTIKVL